MRHSKAALLAFGGVAAFAIASLASCSGGSEGIASIWTDVPEMAIAAELYNTRGGKAAVRLEWKPEPAEALLASKASEGDPPPPALIIGRRLDGASLRDRLSSLESLLARGLDRDSFYPETLEGGVVGGKRVLLPLSFNLPAIAFLRGSPDTGDGFTLTLSDLAAPSASYRKSPGGGRARMGFSPRWNPRFLIMALNSGGGRFGEGKRSGQGATELTWDSRGLDSVVGELASWSARVNGSAALEDDFQFKYLFSPPHRWLKEGRTLYAHMDSSELFLVSEERLAELDFRWYSSGGSVPITGGAVYAGLVRGSGGRAAALSFLRWLFTSEAQRAILERTRGTRAASYTFGIAGGFSSIRAVNEGIFPAFYPNLVGHMPPAGKLALPAPLPEDWPSLQTAVILPWALEACARSSGPLRGDPSAELSARIADYRKRGAR